MRAHPLSHERRLCVRVPILQEGPAPAAPAAPAGVPPPAEAPLGVPCTAAALLAHIERCLASEAALAQQAEALEPVWEPARPCLCD